MLRVEVSINGTVIAYAVALNTSPHGQDVCRYAVQAVTVPSKFNEMSGSNHEFVFEGHDRRDGAWALVADIARYVADEDQPND